MDAPALATVTTARQAVHRVLHGADERLVVVVGPCSIHDRELAMEYARRLHEAGWVEEAGRLYAKAARMEARDAMERLDVEAARAEID